MVMLQIQINKPISFQPYRGEIVIRYKYPESSKCPSTKLLIRWVATPTHL